MIRVLATLALICIAVQSNAQQSAPLEAFARTPRVSDVAISPDRRFLAYVTSSGDARSIVVHDRQGREPTRTLWTNDRNKYLDVAWCGWANPTRLLCGAVTTVGQKSVSSSVLFRATRLIAFNHDGTAPAVLLHESNPRSTLSQDEIIDWTPADPDNVLIVLRQKLEYSMAVYELNVYTSALKQQTRLSGLAEFASDGAGHARLSYKVNETASRTYHVRLTGESAWRRWETFDDFEDNAGIEPEQVLPGANRLIGWKLHEGRRALWEADLERKLPPTLLYAAPGFDVTTIESRNGRPVSVRYDNDRPQVHYLDARTRSVVAGARRFLPDAYISVHDTTDDESAYILRAQSDVDAGTYHLLDVSSKSGELEQVGESYPELRGHELGRMRALEYPARDGKKIPAYLTLPPHETKRPLPLVVMPHDGPIARTNWEFDYLRAFLADRGYAVLEMNYRGSSGYGWDWQQAGHREWGGLVYSDILDGARWAVTTGIADSERVCIAGRGFGGYQALLGATRNSDVYRCAISIGGWTSLTDARDYASWWTNTARRLKQIGRNTTTLLAQSPIHHLDDLRIPVLLVHGELDWKVPATQSRDMSYRLKRRCKPHELLVLPDTDHELRWQSDRSALLAAVERFLAQSLAGPRREPESTCEPLLERQSAK